MFAHTLLPALALIGAVAAQSNTICSTATATINSQADVTPYAACETLTGSVLIGQNAVGVISLDGPQTIVGSLIARNATKLNQIGSTTLEKIGATFELNELVELTNLVFTNLTEVKSISWTALGRLSELQFGASVSKADSVLITNTFLSTLKGIDLTTVNVLDINNNNRLRTFSSKLANVGQTLNIVDNGRALDVTFDNLTWAANMTFRNVSSVSLGSLTNVNGSLGFYGTFIKSLNAPKLSTVGSDNGQGSLAFVANENLANITMPNLISVGGAYQIANNTALTAISFPLLAKVGGAVDFSGDFSTPELPALEDVRGGFNVQSKSNIDCKTFQAQQKSGVIQGKFTCITTDNAQSTDGTKTSGGTGTNGGAASPSASKDAASLTGASQAAVGVSVIGGLLSMLL